MPDKVKSLDRGVKIQLHDNHYGVEVSYHYHRLVFNEQVR